VHWAFPTITTTALGIGALAVRNLLVAKKPALPTCAQVAPPAPELPPLPPEPSAWVRLMRLLRSLFVRQRGEKAWVMLVGAVGGGKTSLATSAAVTAGSHEPWTRVPRLDGAVCHTFPQGVLVDADGALKPAQWNSLLNQIETLRPQRPLDGLMVAVSASSLARPESAAMLAEADLVRQQLLSIQVRYQWVLPVYVVVTGCDRLADGAAFAAAMALIAPGDMVGWSASEVGDYAGAERWSNSAFDQLANRFRECQLRDAAGVEPLIPPYEVADAGFLLPHGLQSLRAPLADWFDVAFRPGTTQQGFMMRGVYFTGASGWPPAKPADPRADVQAVADLVSKKVLAERRLAEPTRAGRASRNIVQRVLLWAVGLLMALLALTLAINTVALKTDLDQLDVSLKAIVKSAAVPATATCLERERVVDLVDRIEHAPLPRYLPWSMIDHDVRDQSSSLVARQALDKVILPALACKLAERAKALGVPVTRTPDSQLAPDSFMTAARDNLLTYLDKVLALEQDYARLRLLSAPNAAADPEAATRALYELLADLYGQRPNGASASGGWPDWIVRTLASVGISLSPRAPSVPSWLVDSDRLMYQSVRRVALPLAMTPPRAEFKANIARLQGQLPNHLTEQLTDGAAALAHLDKSASGLMAPALLDGARQGYAWLSWVQNTLVPSTPSSNPCQDIAGGIADRQTALARFDYDLSVPAGEPYSPAKCYASLMTTLARQSLPGYGPVVVSGSGGKPLQLNPLLVPEMAGLASLLTQDFMQVVPPQEFQCLRQEIVWQPELIQRARDSARDYQLFARKQSVAEATRAPLFDRVARRQLELVMNDTLSAAQSPAASVLGKAGLSAAGADPRLSQLSANFGSAAAPLSSVVQLYQQMGMPGSATALSACVRDQASDGLTRVGELAESSRLYMPLAGVSGGAPFDLAGAAGVQDYLNSQIARLQVLAGYATPYVQVLLNTPAVDDSHKSPSQTAPFWNNTIKQLAQYLAHDSSGEAGKLHNLIASQIPDSDAGPCGTVPAAAPGATGGTGGAGTTGTTAARTPDTGGNEMFSVRRIALQAQLATRCDSRAQSQLVKDYSELSDAFNARMAGRYPFGALSADDAPTAEVKQFFADYGDLLSSVRARYARLAGSDAAASSAQRAGAPSSVAAAQRTRMQRDFLNRLDDLAQALQPGLKAGAPLRIAVSFYAKPQETQGSEQLVVWTLSSGAVTVGAPNRQAGALDWPFGQALSFDLEWADRSALRPMADRTQRDLQISGTSAQFGYSGDWALLRMVEQHRLPDASDGASMLLQFQVPVAPLNTAALARPTGQARVYLSLGLTSKDPKTQAQTPVKLPLSFPHFAPR
jgi:type VI secretion system protein ImpL